MPNEINEPCEPNEADYPEADSPTGEEILLGALAEMMESLGIDPLGNTSQPSDRRIQDKVIPSWFQKLSDDI